MGTGLALIASSAASAWFMETSMDGTDVSVNSRKSGRIDLSGV